MATTSMCTFLMAVLGLTTATISPRVPVLTPAPGLLLGAGSRASKVVLEAFMETNCPDSGKAWPELNKVAEHYTSGDVAVIVHQVPLPYHRNSMICTQGIHAIANLAPDRVKDYITAIYDNNLLLSNSLTYYLNDQEVLNRVADVAVQATGVNKETFKTDTANHLAYVAFAWKYATRRGVGGAPWYVVNGVDVETDPSSLIDKEEWVEYIDGLLE